MYIRVCSCIEKLMQKFSCKVHNEAEGLMKSSLVERNIDGHRPM